MPRAALGGDAQIGITRKFEGVFVEEVMSPGREFGPWNHFGGVVCHKHEETGAIVNRKGGGRKENHWGLLCGGEPGLL